MEYPLFHNKRGFTLIELIVSLIIAVLLALLIAPSFIRLIQQSRIDTTLNAFSATLQYAKSEALRRGNDPNGNNPIVIVRIPPNAPDAPKTATCQSVFSADDWSCGWRIIEDKNNNNALNTNEIVLYNVPNHTEKLGISHGGSANGYIDIQPSGAFGLGHRISVAIRNSEEQAVYGDSICIAVTGRIRLVKNDETGSSCKGKSG